MGEDELSAQHYDVQQSAAADTTSYRWRTAAVSATFKYDGREAEHVTRGCSPSATFSTSGLSHLNVERTTTSLRHDFSHLFIYQSNN